MMVPFNNFFRVIAVLILIAAPLLLHASQTKHHSIADTEIHDIDILAGEPEHTEHAFGDCCSALCGPTQALAIVISKSVKFAPLAPYTPVLHSNIYGRLLRPPITRS